MSFKLFILGSMYPGYLGSFYRRYLNVGVMSYNEHYETLLNDTTEFVGSYTRNFKKLGINVVCAIANDSILQNKWKSENCDKNSGDVLFEQIKKFQPEILWVENLGHTGKKWLEDVREKVKSLKLIIAYHCSPFGPVIIDRMKYVDFVLTCTPGLKLDMDQMGFKSYLVYHGFDNDFIGKSVKPDSFPPYDFVFSGSLSQGAGYHGERIELIENLIKSNIDIALFVNLEKQYKIRLKQSLHHANEFLKKIKMSSISKHIPLLQYSKTSIKNYSEALLHKKKQPVFGIEMYKLFSNSRVVLNFHIGVAGNYAGNMRLFEVTGVGSCLLTDNKINIGDLFLPDQEVVTYDSVDDCIFKAKWLLENEVKRSEIASAGKEKTLTYHTVSNRCKQILEIINIELGRR